MCDEVLSTTITRFSCEGFVSPRLFLVNGKNYYCSTTNGDQYPLPAPVNGGYCMQATAGDNADAGFSTY